jgi:hypothetical protein
MVVEERGLVFPKGVSAKNVSLYFEHYSVQRLRRLAVTRGLKIERFHDAWLSLLATFRLFENPPQAAKLATTVFGGKLFSPESLGPLVNCRLSNAVLFTALERLCNFDHPETKQRTPVNFGALATEEFGSVYESLLELHPVVETEPMPHFGFRQVAGNERKSTGSYYTPTSLVTCLLDSALDPVLEERINNFKPLGFKSVDDAVLALNVCDPACGSGHFLIAAAQRIARRLAILRAGGEEPSPELLRHTLREVIDHCIHGVDVNPMSVELCKVALWLEAVEPGKSLNFLDHHIKCGNSLLGATPEAIREGIPDEAYEPITGDSKEAAKWMRKLNKDAREGQSHFDFTNAKPWERLGNLPAAMAELETLEDETPEALAKKEKAYLQIVEGSGYESARLLHDTWCAAFVWLKQSREYGTELTTEHLRKIEHNPHSVAPSLKSKIRQLSEQYRFFHWHIEFPAVYGSEGKSGFDVILGNPPWERVKLQEKEWFAERRPDIANATNAAVRKHLIERLASEDPGLFSEYHAALRQAEGESHLMRHTGLFPLCGRGDINLYAIFAEQMRRMLSSRGRFGAVLPSGIAADDTTKFYFQEVVEQRSLVSLFDFENKEGLFPAVHREQRFCLFTVSGAEQSDAADFVFFAHRPEHIYEPQRRFRLTSDDIRRLNPNTGTCPIFRLRQDAEITRAIYARVPVAIREVDPPNNPWQMSFSTMFHLTNDSRLFRTYRELEDAGFSLVGNEFIREGERAVPLYEGKLTGIFDHRAGTFGDVPPGDMAKGNQRPLSLSQKVDPESLSIPRWWVELRDLLENQPANLPAFFLAFHDVANPNNERTFIATVIPGVAVGNTLPLIDFNSPRRAQFSLLLCANLNAIVFDYIARLKISSRHFNFFIVKQLPVLSPAMYAQPSLCPQVCSLQAWLLPRVLELTYTAWDLQAFAQDCGFDGPPFRWDEERRFQLRCEVDAAFLDPYLGSDDEWRRQPESLIKYFPTRRDAVAHIMDTFPILKRKDEEKYGWYRTKDTILKIYDDLAESQRTGRPYVSPLNPPPADAACRHPKSKLGILAYGSLIKDPGSEIARRIKFRLKTVTPFPVEYGRYSGKTRGGAPTVVKHDTGAPVAAEILVLDDKVSFDEARDILWRRERRKEGSGETYVESKSPNSVLVREVTDNCVERILYTDFHPEGKIALPDALDLAKAAIKSVKVADNGKDGITYLMDNVAAGIDTPRTREYVNEILRITKTETLEEALIEAQA